MRFLLIIYAYCFLMFAIIYRLFLAFTTNIRALLSFIHKEVDLMSYNPLIFLILVYFVSSIPFSLVISKLLHGVDVRQFGDGNPGAANAWLYGSKLAGFIGCLFDGLKGAFPVLLAKQFWPTSELWVYLTALTAVCGHAYSIFLQFHGGKSLAVTAGVFLTLFESMSPIFWILLVTLFPYIGVPFPEGVVITLATAIVQTIYLYKSWLMRFTVIFISAIVINKHKIALSEVSENGFFAKIKHLAIR